MRIFLCILWLTAALVPIAQAGEYTQAPVDNGASLVGFVTFKGKVPGPEAIEITKDNQICGAGHRKIQWVALAEGKGLQNVAVYIPGIKKGKPFTHPEGGYEMDQRECRFIPNFTAVPRGQTLRVLNGDSLLHNIHTYEIIGRARRTMFNVGQPEKGFAFSRTLVTFKGNAMKVECDIHNFMHAWVFIPRNPYFSVVDEKAGYKIETIPPGKHTVVAWHPTLGEKEAEVTLEPGQALEFDFAFSP